MSIGPMPSAMSATTIFCQPGFPSSAVRRQYFDLQNELISHVTSSHRSGPLFGIANVANVEHDIVQGSGVKNLVLVVYL